MAEATTTTQLYVRLNTELISMVEQFTNLIKGTKEGKAASWERQLFLQAFILCLQQQRLSAAVADTRLPMACFKQVSLR